MAALSKAVIAGDLLLLAMHAGREWPCNRLCALEEARMIRATKKAKHARLSLS